MYLNLKGISSTTRKTFFLIWNLNGLIGVVLVVVHVAFFQQSLTSIVISSLEMLIIIIGSIVVYKFKYSYQIYTPFESVIV